MYVSVKEASVIYGVSIRTIRKWVEDKKIDFYKAENRRVMVKVEEEDEDENSIRKYSE